MFCYGSRRPCYVSRRKLETLNRLINKGINVNPVDPLVIEQEIVCFMRRSHKSDNVPSCMHVLVTLYGARSFLDTALHSIAYFLLLACSALNQTLVKSINMDLLSSLALHRA